MNTYERIKELCASRGISVRNLEEVLGFSYGAISKWAKSDPGYAKIKKVADYFNVTVEYLQTGEIPQYYDNPVTAAIAQEIMVNPDLRALFDAGRDARPEDLQMAAEMLKRFKGNG